ncbi:MAG: insulinase family protein [Chlorobiota bacterium]|jgi:predicted Zn-dependent peptidase|nr:insulinase family protein [Chlorobiota bacterium]QQS66723.1 MAG: insulinase family protein [Chlorobiota bacterium]
MKLNIKTGYYTYLILLIVGVTALTSCGVSRKIQTNVPIAASINDSTLKVENQKTKILDSIKSIPSELTIIPPKKNSYPDVKEFNAGGLPVIMRSTGGGQRIITVKLYIKGGTSYLSKGVSPALEQLAMIIPFLSGPDGTDKIEYQKSLNKMYAGIAGGDGRDFSVVTLRCIDSDFEKVWNYFTDIISKPKFDSVEFRSVKERIINGVKNRTASPEGYASFLADSIFFAGHPYGRYAQVKEVEKLTIQDAETHFKSLFQKSRLFMVVIGAVDSTNIYNKTEKAFYNFPVGNYKELKLDIPKNASMSSVNIVKPEKGRSAPTSYIIARYLSPNIGDSLYYPMMRLTSFLGGSLFREVRVERNLSYAPDANVEFGKISYGEISISTTLPDSAWRTSRNYVLDFFKDYILQDISMKSGLASWITSNNLKEQTSLSQADEIGEAYFYTGSWLKAYNVLEQLKKITPEQLNETAQKYLKNFTVVVYGNSKGVNKKEFVY